MPFKEAPMISVTVDKPTMISARDKEEEEWSSSISFGDGRLNKMEVDYSSTVDGLIPQADSLSKQGKVNEAVDFLAPIEKQTRLGYDVKSNTRIVCHMVNMAFEYKKFELLNETIKSLCKKRALIKYSVKKMIQSAVEMIDGIEHEDMKFQLVETLRNVTAGKIYVEVERARLTKLVADKRERDGKVDEARAVIMELQVETYGSMEVKEKVKYLLQQMRLSIATDDFFKAAVISRKISPKFFNSDEIEIQEMKLEFYDYSIGIELNDDNYLEVCKHYLAVFKSPNIAENEPLAKEILKRVVLYVLLSRYDNERSDLMHNIKQIKQLELVPEYNSLLSLFIKEEMIFWRITILNNYESLLRTPEPCTIFSERKFLLNPVFPCTEEGDKRFKIFHNSVGEHNVRLIAKYYTQITFDRMAQLLEFTVEEMESFVCKIIADGIITDVKIHRPSRIINFKAVRAHIEILDQWGSNVRVLTDTLNKISHLILKEQMVHGAIKL